MRKIGLLLCLGLLLGGMCMAQKQKEKDPLRACLNFAQ